MYPPIGPISLSYKSAVEELIATPDPLSAPEIVLRDAEILAWLYAVIPAPSVVVIMLSLISSVCLIEPVCLKPLVLTAAQFTLISELTISPEDCLKNTPNPLSEMVISSMET